MTNDVIGWNMVCRCRVDITVRRERTTEMVRWSLPIWDASVEVTEWVMFA